MCVYILYKRADHSAFWDCLLFTTFLRAERKLIGWQIQPIKLNRRDATQRRHRLLVGDRTHCKLILLKLTDKLPPAKNVVYISSASRFKTESYKILHHHHVSVERNSSVISFQNPPRLILWLICLQCRRENVPRQLVSDLGVRHSGGPSIHSRFRSQSIWCQLSTVNTQSLPSTLARATRRGNTQHTTDSLLGNLSGPQRLICFQKLKN